MLNRMQSRFLVALLAIAATHMVTPPVSAGPPELVVQQLREELEELGPPLSPVEVEAKEPVGFGYECSGDLTVGPFWIQKTGRGFDRDGRACTTSSFVVTFDDQLVAAFDGSDTFSSFVDEELDPENDTPELVVSFHSMAIRELHDVLIVTKLPSGRWDTIALNRVSDRSNNGLTNVWIEDPDLIVGMDDHSIFTEGVEAASAQIPFRPLRFYRLRGGKLIDQSFDPAHRGKLLDHLRQTIELAVTEAPLGSDQPKYHSLGFWASYTATQAALGRLHASWVRALWKIDFEKFESGPEEVSETSLRETVRGRLVRSLKENGYIAIGWQPPQSTFLPSRAPPDSQSDVLAAVLEDDNGQKRFEKAMVPADTCDSILSAFIKSGPFLLTMRPIGGKQTTTGRAISLHCIAPDGAVRSQPGRTQNH